MVSGFSPVPNGHRDSSRGYDWTAILLSTMAWESLLENHHYGDDVKNVPCGDLRRNRERYRQAPSNHRKWRALISIRKVIGPVTVGEYAKIGAAAVVLDDIPAYTTVGLPARVVRVHTPEEELKEIRLSEELMIQIYNTLTRQKAFKPIEEGKVSMYVCGPTVYNYIHIGNARSTVSFDTIRRYFEYRGYDVLSFQIYRCG